MVVRGFVSDVDGTLLRSDGTLSPATIAMLGRMRNLGVPFLPATARTPRAVRKIAGHEHFGRMVCANGAVVWDAGTDEVVSEQPFDAAVLSAGLARLRAMLPEAGLALLTARRSFLDAAYLALRGTGVKDAEPLPDPGAVVAVHGIVMVAVRHAALGTEELSSIVAVAFAGAGIVSFSGVGVVEVAPLGIDKAVAVAAEMNEARVPAEAVVAFGDMPNDLPLFAWAGRSCAVANAHPRVLEAADEVVPSNDDDGVAVTVGRALVGAAGAGPTATLRS